jgi:hypothetical protein
MESNDDTDDFCPRVCGYEGREQGLSLPESRWANRMGSKTKLGISLLFILRAEHT